MFDIRVFYLECKTLARSGYDVALVIRHARDEVIDGVRVCALPNPANRLSRMTLLSARAFARALRENASVREAVAASGAAGEARGLAVAVDGEVVPRGRWDAVELHEGQRVEIVQAVQGG